MDDEPPPKVESTRDLRPLTEWFSVEDGQQTFSRCTFAIVTNEYRVYIGQAPIRKYNLTAKIINESLKFVPDEEVYPEAPPNITIALDPTNDKKFFIKGPTLSLYDTLAGTDSLSRLLLQEAEALELLSGIRQHPNVVRYHGCLVKRGRIVGIVLDRLTELLEYRFEDKGREPFDAEACMRKMKSVVQFLHSQGLAHNDIKPTNIMLNEHDEPYIIDLGSCLPFGSLLITGGTLGWIDEEYTHSARWNDEIALRKLRTWLKEKTST
jgi:serine/threonine protein kinase